ncbi:MAG: 30S ribosomal protein S7 [Chloroflexi bacterium]|nr:30S ribosomal protein S7 [Chloroflexota bacterium]
MRRRRAVRRKVQPDWKFHREDLTRFIHKIMLCGKKSVAQRIVYGALDIVEKKAGRPALEVWDQALKNATPVMQVKPRRVGGATYQVPVEIRPEIRSVLAMRWLVAAARARKSRPMAERLAAELLDAARGQGAAVKRREDLFRMAEANRAFVHYRW